MALGHLVTRGYGNGTLAGDVNLLPARGYTAGAGDYRDFVGAFVLDSEDLEAWFEQDAALVGEELDAWLGW